MSDSLRDQLLGLGFKAPPKPERKPEHRGGGRPGAGKGGQGRHRGGDASAGPSQDGKPGQRRDGQQRGAQGRDGQGRDGQGRAKPGDRPRGGGSVAPAGRPGGAPPEGGAGEGAGANRGKRGGRGRGRSGGGAPRSQEDIDLAKAYAIRAQREKQERIDAEAAKQEAARIRREARARFDAFIEGKTLNVADAEIARHFEYGGKIKRVYVTPDQLRALNAGELGVLQQKGRYLLVTAGVLAEAKAIFADGVALEVDPNAAPGDDPYADPKYQVPDDLVW